MIIKNKQIGDNVGLRIPKVDRTNTSKKILPCRILKKTGDNRFTLFTASGILGTTFSHTDLIDFRNISFAELDGVNQPELLDTIPFTRAARHISGFTNNKTTKSMCNCKGTCLSGRCACKKNLLKCSTKCHSNSNNCENK